VALLSSGFDSSGAISAINLSADGDAAINRNIRQQIPKRIIQIGRDQQFSVRQRAVMANMKLLNQEYEYLYFDNQQKEEFVRSEYPQYLDVYEAFRYPIQRYDFFRYLAVHFYGGFYFDLDVLLASGLSSLLELECVFTFETITTSHYLRDNLGMDWQIGNYAFGAIRQHPFLAAIIENCVRGQRDPYWVKPMMRGTPPIRGDEYYVLNSTGPGLVSRTFAENPDLAKMVTVLYPGDVCDLRNRNCFGEFGTHLADSSWRMKQSFLLSKLSGYLERWIWYERVKDSRKRRMVK
jgi:inositol phosphorylceramide mannosyltransferase catalytic subunit